VRAIARAVTIVENRAAGYDSLLFELSGHDRKVRLIGITGAPGAGKSTLIDQFVRALRRQGHRVAILAVDPSSPFTGGAILGDRVRMQAHHADPGVFIRSMATRGRMGGVAEATADVVRVLEAAGFDTILIETVGVGQGEVDIQRLADCTAVVLVPGMGDDVQAIKAGIMEIADVYILNKADYPGIERLEREIAGASAAPVVRCVATEGRGIDEALAAVQSTFQKERNS
jgi:LAO/AO transport system kinase